MPWAPVARRVGLSYSVKTHGQWNIVEQQNQPLMKSRCLCSLESAWRIWRRDVHWWCEYLQWFCGFWIMLVFSYHLNHLDSSLKSGAVPFCRGKRWGWSWSSWRSRLMTERCSTPGRPDRRCGAGRKPEYEIHLWWFGRGVWGGGEWEMDC